MIKATEMFFIKVRIGRTFKEFRKLRIETDFIIIVENFFLRFLQFFFAVFFKFRLYVFLNGFKIVDLFARKITPLTEHTFYKIGSHNIKISPTFRA